MRSNSSRSPFSLLGAAPSRLVLGALLASATSTLAGCGGGATSAPEPEVAPAPVAPAKDPLAWLDRSASADERAKRLVEAMTQQEKLTVITGYFGVQADWSDYRYPEARKQSAGLVRGVPRLQFTPQWQTDAGSGVATQGEAPPELERTALPSGLLTASTWNPQLAERGGQTIGSEARSSGFNVMLAGGVNLLREPGNGRNFEYGGEDPWLAGTMVGALVRGIQSNHIVATVKHFALNDQETGRNWVDVHIDEAAARESDLLAFQFAIEQGKPGSVMCSYNLVNGVYACQNEWLLNQVLKRDWAFDGYVMTDWGAQHDTVENANSGLDQETGVLKLDSYQWLEKLDGAIQAGKVQQSRLDDMVRRIARTLIASGVIDLPPELGPIDFDAHEQVAQADAEEGMVLLQNDGVLPIAATAKRIVVIGGHADVGVLTGGGSAQVYARGGNQVRGLGPSSWPGPHVYAKSSPLEALRAELPGAKIEFVDGKDPAVAARAARGADVALVFATQWTTENMDFEASLPDGQDQLVEAVAKANRRTVVVLENGGPLLLPWASRVAAILEAWYPGSRGGPAIARVLTGKVNPSGHLAATFPRSLEQLPRPRIAGQGLPDKQRFVVEYTEGSAVGYRWFAARKQAPQFSFGHGLSYTTFAYENLGAKLVDGELEASFRVKNTGKRAGRAVAQIYVSPVAGGWEAPLRLGAFQKVALEPGSAQEVTVRVDPRLLARFVVGRGFHVAAGEYRITLANSATDAGTSVNVTLPERWLAAGAGAKAP
ncbi:MAG TPA: glycoside hydrolase family 3 C-terminal domain-containing protein [Polyangiaceae bacterium]|nr:glycoside hydrolase family 3 C-terminal domain-containing protein [Polyangiaceae bacterium]